MSITAIVNKVFQTRQRELEAHVYAAEALQNKILKNLISRGRETEYGRKHLFDVMKGYESFTSHVPINTYEELKNDIDRMRHGESDILWPGRIR